MVERFSLRTKLVAACLFVVVAGGVLSSLVGTRLVADAIISQARTKVAHDLNTAALIYDRSLERIRDVVELTASGRTLPNQLEARQWDQLTAYLDGRRESFGLDFLTVTDIRGDVLLRTYPSAPVGDTQASDPVVERALRGEVAAATVISSRENLEREGPGLAERAYTQLVPTPRARPVPVEQETSGMTLKAAAPIRDDGGRLVGVLYGGLLLNRHYTIVDEVRDLLYGSDLYKGREVGTATIFMGDTRIATNVLDEQGERAIGSRVSEEVYRAVIEGGQVWLDRAFVVHDWYLTGYQPIRDMSGRIVGMIYVGLLENPYIDLRNRVVLSFFGIGIFGVLFVVLLYTFITNRITRPLFEMVVATGKIAEGDFSIELTDRSSDEIGQLARSFNNMRNRLQQARQELEEYGRTLEQKVEERTRQLTDMQDQLIQSERLASMGQLAASIAHEVNNPLSGVLIYSQLVAKKVSREEFDRETVLGYLARMEEEISRSTRLVRSLLDFAVQSEPIIKQVDVNELLNRALELGIHAGSRGNTRVTQDLKPLPPLPADPDQLEQVFVNLIINALQAMPDGGMLTLRTLVEQGEIKISVSDTGCGIPAHNLNKIFNPFFSTKKDVKGVGLGLSVSYGIVQSLKGRIEVASQEGEGTTFTVCLPLHGTEEEEDRA